jgi:hypothetical protein
MCVQDQLGGSLSATTVSSTAAGCVMPSNHTHSSSQFCVPSQPLHVVCPPTLENDGKPYRFMSPSAAACPPVNSNTAVPLMTLPQMTVQSIETYPVALHLQPGLVQQQPQQQQANVPAQSYCFEISNIGQLKPDAAYKGNTPSVLYTPLGMQVPLSVQPARYHQPVGCSLNAPFQSVMYSEQLAETVQTANAASTPSSLQYVYYSTLSALGHSTESAISQTPYSQNSLSAHSVVPVNTCCSSAPSANSRTVNVQSCDLTHFGSNTAEYQPRPVAYRHAVSLSCNGKYYTSSSSTISVARIVNY